MEANTVTLDFVELSGLATLLRTIEQMRQSSKQFKVGGVVNISTREDGEAVGYIDLDEEKIQLHYLNFSSGRSQQ